jgi:CDP-2,3-bis-(O-geranylgeranyl)-sn-glycerol synthase
MAETFTKLLIMLLATNAAPVLAALIFKSHGNLPLDLGRQMSDRQPIFGSSKTWRGVIVALIASYILSVLFSYGSVFGVVFGLLVIAGDLFSSFIKRRMGLQPSDQCIGLDQLPESFIPSVYAVAQLELDWWWAVVLPMAFILVEVLISKPLFLLKIRNRPY